MNKTKSPAVDVAKEVISRNGAQNRIIELPYGVRAKLNPVSAALIDDVTSRVKEPEVPMVYIEDKDRTEPNPLDPRYLRELAEVNNLRGRAAMDALVMLGIELIDGLPTDTGWLIKLRYLEKLDRIDLSAYNLEDEMDLTYLFLRYVAIDNSVIGKISAISGISQAEVLQAEDSFPG